MLRLDQKLEICPIPDVTVTTKDSGRIDLWEYFDGNHKGLSFTSGYDVPEGMNRTISTLGCIKFKGLPKGEYTLYISVLDLDNKEHGTQFNLKVIEPKNLDILVENSEKIQALPESTEDE